MIVPRRGYHPHRPEALTTPHATLQLPMNEINDVLVVSDDPYFAEGAATLLHRYTVIRISGPFSRMDSFNADFPVAQMVVLFVNNTLQEKRIAGHFSLSGVPVLVVSDRRAEPGDALKNKDVYLADRNIRGSGLRQMVDAIFAKREAERIHLSLIQGNATRPVKKGCLPSTSAGCNGIPAFTVRMHECPVRDRTGRAFSLA
ncbi:hypothetical protein WJU79_004246 [Citrobacter freundii]